MQFVSVHIYFTYMTLNPLILQRFFSILKPGSDLFSSNVAPKVRVQKQFPFIDVKKWTLIEAKFGQSAQIYDLFCYSQHS